MDGCLQIKTGVKLAQFSSLKGNIPLFIHVGRHRVRTAYRGQIKTCRNCHKQGHEVKDCNAGRVCKQCGEPGHTKAECPEKVCFQCLGKGHEINECPEYRQAFPRLEETIELREQTDPPITLAHTESSKQTDPPITLTNIESSNQTDPPITLTNTDSSNQTDPPITSITDDPPTGWGDETAPTQTETRPPLKDTAAIRHTQDSSDSGVQQHHEQVTIEMEISPSGGEASVTDPRYHPSHMIPPIPHDSTDSTVSSGGEDEPPKTQKNQKTATIQQGQ